MADLNSNTAHLDALRARWEQEPNSRIYIQLAEEYRKHGRVAEAVEVLQKGLAQRPRDLSGLVALGRCRLELGEIDAALETLEGVVQRDAAHIVANKLLVDGYLLRGDADEARSRLDICRLLSDSDPDLEGFETRLAQLESGPEAPVPMVDESPPEALLTESAVDIVSTLDPTPVLEAAAVTESVQSPPSEAPGTEAPGMMAAPVPDAAPVFDLSAPTAESSAADDIFALGAPPPPPSFDLLWQEAGGVLNSEAPATPAAPVVPEPESVGVSPEPVGSESAPFESTMQESARLETTQPEPAPSEPAPSELAQSEPAQLEPTQSEPAQLEPTQPESAQLEPTQPEPLQPETTEPAVLELGPPDAASPELPTLDPVSEDGETDPTEKMGSADDTESSFVGNAVAGLAAAAGLTAATVSAIADRETADEEAASSVSEDEDTHRLPKVTLTDSADAEEDTRPMDAVPVVETAPAFEEVSAVAEIETVSDGGWTVDDDDTLPMVPASPTEFERTDTVVESFESVPAAPSESAAELIEPTPFESFPAESSAAEEVSTPESALSTPDSPPDELRSAATLASATAAATAWLESQKENASASEVAESIPEIVATAEDSGPIESTDEVRAAADEEAPIEQTATATLGELYLRQGHTDEAERIFLQVLEREPKNPAALAGLRKLHQAGQKPLDAEKLLAESSASGTLPPGLTAKKILVLKGYLEHLRGMGSNHVQ